MLSLFKIENLKAYAIIIGIVAAVWFYKDYKYQKSENQRQSENIAQIRTMDSLRFASQTYTKAELEEYLEYNNPDLQSYLEEQSIKINRIERIVTQSLNYSDNTEREVNLQPILDAIKQQRELKVPVIDSTDCLIVKGYVAFEKDTLSLNITERQFKNKSDIVTYWERNQWSFLGIKTRLFGRKKGTVTVKDNCGNTETFEINIK